MTVSSAEEMSSIVKRELERISDSIVLEALQHLCVVPSCHERRWDYGPGLSYQCWSVAEHEESNTLYIYCEEGFGPLIPWGIVSLSGTEMGMDSNWFETLERAFYDSFAADPLPIWNVVKRNTADNERLVATSLRGDEAWALRSKLNVNRGSSSNGSLIFDVEPRTQKWW